MIYCRGCGQQIHETAQACPNCGAAQSRPATGANHYDTYEEVPWYRRTVAVVLFLFLLPPALWLVCLTGEVYYKSREGTPKPNGIGPRIALVLFSIVWLSALAGNT